MSCFVEEEIEKYLAPSDMIPLGKDFLAGIGDQHSF